MIKLTIPGQPIPLARPRFFGGKVVDSQVAVKNGIRKLICSELVKIGVMSSAGMPFKLLETYCNCAIHVDLTFGMATAKNLSKTRKNSLLGDSSHNCKPDLDNLIKFILDCGNKLLWSDDCMISEIHARKIWCDSPHTEITMQHIPVEFNTT